MTHEIAPLQCLPQGALDYNISFIYEFSSRAYSTYSTYDHRLVRTGHPVRSAILKHQIGRLVVGWVTTSESLLLYVFLLRFVIDPLHDGSGVSRGGVVDFGGLVGGNDRLHER